MGKELKENHIPEYPGRSPGEQISCRSVRLTRRASRSSKLRGCIRRITANVWDSPWLVSEMAGPGVMTARRWMFPMSQWRAGSCWCSAGLGCRANERTRWHTGGVDGTAPRELNDAQGVLDGTMKSGRAGGFGDPRCRAKERAGWHAGSRSNGTEGDG